jgi:hypothetical protein
VLTSIKAEKSVAGLRCGCNAACGETAHGKGQSGVSGRRGGPIRPTPGTKRDRPPPFLRRHFSCFIEAAAENNLCLFIVEKQVPIGIHQKHWDAEIPGELTHQDELNSKQQVASKEAPRPSLRNELAFIASADNKPFDEWEASKQQKAIAWLQKTQRDAAAFGLKLELAEELMQQMRSSTVVQP